MVFFFCPRGYGSPGKDDYLLYMGKDKYENEDLIRYALPQDVWFHVDALSSAHVYLRLPEGASLADIPADTLEDAVQLVKANSIQGNKLNNLEVVYTPAANLKKAASMDVGQVGFYDQKAVKKVAVLKRVNDVVNRLNKTRREEYPDLAAEREAWDREQRSRGKAEAQAQRLVEKEAREEGKRAADLRSYKGVMDEEHMTSAAELRERYATVEDYEDDFL